MKNFDVSQERRRLLKLFEQYEYGELPPRPKHLKLDNEVTDISFAAGKARLISFNLKCELESGGIISFPVSCAIPSGDDIPAFIHIKEDSLMPDRHQPTEELCDGGFAVFTLAEDKIIIGGARGKFARAVSPGRSRLDSPGRLMLLAWCAMRVIDLVAIGYKGICLSRTAVVGHGIYAAAALLAAAFDERVAHTISSSGGFAGAALITESRGELFELKQKYPDVFSRRYLKLSGRESSLPFDQDSLLALIAPRRVFLDNSDGTPSRSPHGELLSAIRASRRYQNRGKTGLIYPESADPCEISASEEIYFTGGEIVYRKRKGLPYLSREDWAEYMRFLK